MITEKSADQETASEILDAATRLLAHYGYSKTTVDDIAREAGIGKGSVYLHFESKEEIALSCINRIVDEVFDELRAIADDETLPAAQRLRNMLRTRVSGRLLRFGIFSRSLFDVLASLRPSLLLQRKRHLEEEQEIFESIIKKGINSKEFRTVDLSRTAEAFLTATNSLLPYYLSSKELGSPVAIGIRVDLVSGLMIAGLCRRVPSTWRPGQSTRQI